MTEIQWRAFSLIVRALGILLFELVGRDDPLVDTWQNDIVSFFEQERDK